MTVSFAARTNRARGIIAHPKRGWIQAAFTKILVRRKLRFGMIDHAGAWKADMRETHPIRLARPDGKP